MCQVAPHQVVQAGQIGCAARKDQAHTRHIDDIGLHQLHPDKVDQLQGALPCQLAQVAAQDLELRGPAGHRKGDLLLGTDR